MSIEKPQAVCQREQSLLVHANSLGRRHGDVVFRTFTDERYNMVDILHAPGLDVTLVPPAPTPEYGRAPFDAAAYETPATTTLLPESMPADQKRRMLLWYPLGAAALTAAITDGMVYTYTSNEQLYLVAVPIAIVEAVATAVAGVVGRRNKFMQTLDAEEYSINAIEVAFQACTSVRLPRSVELGLRGKNHDYAGIREHLRSADWQDRVSPEYIHDDSYDADNVLDWVESNYGNRLWQAGDMVVEYIKHDRNPGEFWQIIQPMASSLSHAASLLNVAHQGLTNAENNYFAADRPSWLDRKLLETQAARFDASRDAALQLMLDISAVAMQRSYRQFAEFYAESLQSE